RAGVVLGQHAFEGFVVPLDSAHGVVDQGADLRALGVGLQMRPAAFLGYPEDVVGEVFVLVLGGLQVFGQEFCVARLEGIRDVLEENKAQGNVFVVAGLHIAAQLVGGLEEFGLEAQVGGVAVVGFLLCHVRPVGMS